MGYKIQTFRLKWSVYVLHLALLAATGLVYFIFQYTRDFFTMYQSINQFFGFLQGICIFLMVLTLVMLFLQYRKAGTFTFYANGLVDERTGDQYFYNDIMTYYFIPANNKNATSLQFELDNGQKGQLTALLPARAFELLQEKHAKIWVPFLQDKLDRKEILTFDLHEDLTSFKLSGELVDESERSVSLSHEGLVLYNQFHPWEEISRYEISFTGMLSFKDKQFKTIWLEPIVSIDRYYDFMRLVSHYVDNVGSASGMAAKAQRFSAQRLLDKLTPQSASQSGAGERDRQNPASDQTLSNQVSPEDDTNPQQGGQS